MIGGRTHYITGMRLDLWLWAVRLFKTRRLSTEAIKAGHVRINGELTKPAREIRQGETVTVRVEIMTRTLKVLGSPTSRVGAKLVTEFAEDLTPPEEYAKQRESVFEHEGARPRGTGRPTKRERRLLEKFVSDPNA